MYFQVGRGERRGPRGPARRCHLHLPHRDAGRTRARSRGMTNTGPPIQVARIIIMVMYAYVRGTWVLTEIWRRVQGKSRREPWNEPAQLTLKRALGQSARPARKTPYVRYTKRVLQPAVTY